ncbi:MAG: hypothetical protein ACXVPU_15750, partial [Bacteroidia bacterium]
KEVKKYHGEKFSVIPLRLIILLMFLSTIVFSQENNNPKYDLNDPRNPDCPCHKLQKQAEDEYKQMQLDNNIGNQIALNTNKINPVNENKSELNDKGIDRISNQEENNYKTVVQKSVNGFSSSGAKQKKKNLLWMIRKKRNIYRIKHSKIKKFKINISNCFHWD